MKDEKDTDMEGEGESKEMYSIYCINVTTLRNPVWFRHQTHLYFHNSLVQTHIWRKPSQSAVTDFVIV